MKDESGAISVLLVIHPSTCRKIWAVPNKKTFWISKTLGRPGVNSTPFAKSFLNVSQVFELLTKANIYSLLPLLPSGENILSSQPHAFFKPAKPVLALLNIITQIDHGAVVSRHQLNKSPTSVASLNVQPTNISSQMTKPMHCEKLPSFPIHFLNFRLPPLAKVQEWGTMSKAFL